MLHTCPPSTMPLTLLTRYGEALLERRELHYPKQEDVAVASTRLAREHPELFQAFSQQWVSRLEGDDTGERIRRAHPLKLSALAYLLRLDSGEFLARVGVPIAPVPLLETDSTVKGASGNAAVTRREIRMVRAGTPQGMDKPTAHSALVPTDLARLTLGGLLVSRAPFVA